jgi:hypothetical protein
VFHQSIFDLGEFVGDDPDQQPELMDPVFYPSSEVPAGHLAIPYGSYQETYQYSSSLNPGIIYPLHDRSGLLYVPSADSVQHGFYVVMQPKPSNSRGDVVIKQWLRSNKVDIPAYHKIHDFTVSSYVWQDTTTGFYYTSLNSDPLASATTDPGRSSRSTSSLYPAMSPLPHRKTTG